MNNALFGIPIKDIEKLLDTAPSIIKQLQQKKSVNDILGTVEPNILPIIEDVANKFYPGSGTVIEIFAFLISKAHPMTFEEEQAWMNRTTQYQGG